MLEHVLQINMLFDFYAPLLTKRQQIVLKYYYSDDLSLGEIAENEGISRQGIHDIVKRAENSLYDYEEKLGLVKRFRRNCKVMKEIEGELQGLASDTNRQSIETITEKLKQLLA